MSQFPAGRYGLLGLLMLAPGVAGAEPVTHGFRISGVAVSARDGSPLTHCRVSAMEAARAGSPGDFVPGGQEFSRFGSQGGGDGGFSGRRGSGGTMPPVDDDSVLTDARGRFSLTVAHAGLWRLTGVARGFQTQTYDQHEGFFAGVAVSDTVPEVSVTLRLTPDGAISGIVFDEAGEPVRQAQVSVKLAQTPAESQPAGRDRGGSAGSTQTDDRGHYEIAGLAPGSYRLNVQAQPWYAAHRSAAADSPDPSLDLVYAPTWYPSASDESGAETLALSGGEERQADFHLTPIPAIHLLIARTTAAASSSGPDAPDDRARGERPPSVIRESGGIDSFGGGSYATSGSQWDIGGLSPGIYQVRVPDANGRGGTVREIALGAGSHTVGLESALAGTPVTVRLEGDAADAVREIALSDTASGAVFEVGGRRGGRRGGDDRQEDDENASSDRSLSVPPGRYSVAVAGSGAIVLTGVSAVGAQVAGRTVTIADGPATLVLRVAAGKAAVSGVARRDGKPVEGAMVLLVPASFGQPDALAPVVRAETNTDGSFNLENVLPGPYILVAIDHGWEVNWRDEATLARYLMNGVPVAPAGGKTVKQEIVAVTP